MQGTKIEQQVRGVIQALGEADGLSGMLAGNWRIYHCFLEEQNLLPERAEDIPQSSFPMFVSHCEAHQMEDRTLHLVLAVVRVVLLELGYDVKALCGLSAPRKRKRLSNSNDGHYRFALTHATDPQPVTGAKSGSVSAGREQDLIAVDASPHDPRSHHLPAVQMNDTSFQENKPHTAKA
jgi:hypothetical protein